MYVDYLIKNMKRVIPFQELADLLNFECKVKFCLKKELSNALAISKKMFIREQHV